MALFAIVIVAMFLTMAVPFECTDRAVLGAYLFGALSCGALAWAVFYELAQERRHKDG